MASCMSIACYGLWLSGGIAVKGHNMECHLVSSSEIKHFSNLTHLISIRDHSMNITMGGGFSVLICKIWVPPWRLAESGFSPPRICEIWVRSHHIFKNPSICLLWPYLSYFSGCFIISIWQNVSLPLPPEQTNAKIWVAPSDEWKYLDAPP